MTRIGRVAMVFAVLASAISLADAVHHGVTGRNLLDDATSPFWVTALVGVVLGGTFALLAAVLVEQAERIDAGSRVVRWIRRVLLGDLAVLAVAFLGGPAVQALDSEAFFQAWGVLGGVGFLLMFVVGVALGVCLLRRPAMRLEAVLIASPIVVIPLTVLLQAVASDWAHPGYAETVLYLGLALLGRSAPQWTDATDPRRTAPAEVAR